MDRIILGKTGYELNKNGFGALPIQRVPMKEAVYLLHKAFDNGINYFDTARVYSDSEEKLGEAFGGDKREKIIISTKTMTDNVTKFWDDLEISLRLLKTDYIDIYQFHNPSFIPRPGDETGLYDAMLKAKEQGKIRHIGITNHRISLANEIVQSGLYETLQYPFSYLASEKDLALVQACKDAGMGFIAMKGLAGGLITNSAACYAFMNQEKFSHVAPIWGIQKEEELDEWLSYQDQAPKFDKAMQTLIENDKKELSGDFCRGCGYCMPCPVGIQINNCARMSLMLRRAPAANWLTEEWQKNMARIEDCLHCGSCMSKCPYGLNTPKLLQKNLEDYKTFLS